MGKYSLPPIPKPYTLDELEKEIIKSFNYLKTLKKSLLNPNTRSRLVQESFETEAKKVLDLYHKAIIRFKSNITNQLDISKQFKKQYESVIKDLDNLGYPIKFFKIQEKEIRNSMKQDIKAAFHSQYDIKESEFKHSIKLWKESLKTIDKGIFEAWQPKTTILDVGKWSKYKQEGGKWKTLQKRAWSKQQTTLSRAIGEHIKAGLAKDQSIKSIMKGIIKELDQVFPDGKIPIRRNITTKTGGKKLITSYLDVGTYAQGWIKTFDTLAYNQSYIANCIKLGIKQVTIKGTATSCPICKTYIGKTYNISKGSTSGIGRLPPYHVNCDCVLATYYNRG